VQGSCLCGDVGWEYVGALQFMAACHCSMCRKSHGTAFATAVGGAADGFAWLRGEERTRQYRSSAELERRFCPRCGSPVPTPPQPGGLCVLNSGTLDDDPGIRLSAHIFAASKAPWHEIDNDAARFDAYPPGMPAPSIDPVPLSAPEPGVVRGSCLCGGVAFEIRGELEPILNCHCSRCRKAHAAAHASILRVAPEQFCWVRGEALRERFDLPDAHSYQHCFCRTCGSSLPQHHPGLVGVHAGALDDDPGVRAGLHIWAGSKAPWFEIGDALPSFDEYPPAEVTDP